jgi:hypothetical protein
MLNRWKTYTRDDRVTYWWACVVGDGVATVVLLVRASNTASLVWLFTAAVGALSAVVSGLRAHRVMRGA